MDAADNRVIFKTIDIAPEFRAGAAKWCPVIRNFRVVVVILVSLLLISCKSQLASPAAPSNFQVTAGNGQAVLTWDEDPALLYSVYYQVGDQVSPGNYINFATRISSPFTVTGLANQTQYAFILNASNQGSVPGPSTPIVTVTPGASGTGPSWTVGGSLVAKTLRGVAYGGSNFVAVGDGGSVFVATESNTSSGVGTWSQPPTGIPISDTINLSSIIFNGTAFIVLAADGSIMSSPDTVTWTLGEAVGSGQWTSLAYSNGVYVAVGFGGAIATNTNAGLQASSAWTPQASGVTTQDLYGVSSEGGLFVAVGKGGVLLTSPDGVAWTKQISNTANNLYQVAYDGANTYVGVGDAGTIITSPDGTNWALQTAITTQNLYAVAYGVSSKFVVVGGAGTILDSTIGSEGTWTESSAGTVDLNSIVAAKVFVAVGGAGANVSGR